jgi:hypothetical protein
MDRSQIEALLHRLNALGSEALEIEELLASSGLDDRQIVNHAAIRANIVALEELLRREVVDQAAARVDFRDDRYRFIRAIDGDTIVVEPPDILREYIKDVHVRLYGLETPERWEELGEQYREHLHELCAIDAGGRLSIVWERERAGNTYGGFPLTSFERGIGHVFFEGPGGRFLYVNGIMNMLRHSSIERKGKSLLRGRHRTRDFELPWAGACPNWDGIRPAGESNTLSSVLGLSPPACLVSFTRLPMLDPREPSFAGNILESLKASWHFGCPFEDTLLRSCDALHEKLRLQQASPFDVPLRFAHEWAVANYERRSI